MSKRETIKPRLFTIAVYILPAIISVTFAFVYTSMQMRSIYGGDSGDLVAAAYVAGIPHSPGYPLYTLLGYILSHVLPFETVAWRIGLLSSIPFALSIFFLWKILHKLTHDNIISSLLSVLYATLYPIWLYAMAQEVFGLFMLFTSVLLYLYILWDETRDKQYFYWMTGIGALSMSHQHVVLFLLIPLFYTIYDTYHSYIKSFVKDWWLILLLVLSGLLPYIYAPIVSNTLSPLIFEDASTPYGFWRLISRAMYGTFKASHSVNASLVDRVVTVATFIVYWIKDFTPFVLIFIGLSFVYLRKKKKELYAFFIRLCAFLLFFFFYSGFPLGIDYHIGTIERFFILPYQVSVILTGVGIYYGLQILKILLKKVNAQFLSYRILYVTIIIILSTFIIKQIRYNFYILSPLTHDKTMETLASDMLSAVPKNAIVNASTDTTIFSIMYSHFVLGTRPDIKLIEFYKLFSPQYRRYLAHAYPDLVLPDIRENEPYTQTFINANVTKFPIVSDVPSLSTDKYWVPYGLFVFYYDSVEHIPSSDVVIAKNKSLQESYEFLRYKGALSRYNHLMLSDARRIYADSFITYAFAFVDKGYFDETYSSLLKALSLETSERAFKYLDITQKLISYKQCVMAKDILDELKTKWGDKENIMSGYDVYNTECTIATPAN